MINFTEIFVGWKNFLIKDKEFKKTAEDRLEKCIECPDKLYEKITNRCTGCGCFMPAKVWNRTSKCKKGYW